MTTLIKHPEEFKDGVRILMLTLRSKDGGKKTSPDRVAVKLVSRNREEFDECFIKLCEQYKPGYRIYSTVDQRDIPKAIRKLKEEQLNNDYNMNEQMENLYVDIHNRWISALQQPTARKTSLFLWDCDDMQQYDDVANVLFAVGAPIVHRYHTKNGGHIITAPFNYTVLDRYSYQPLCMKNAMMLWLY